MITDAPVDQRVKSGGIAAFRCLASGDPRPHISWRKNGNRISDTQQRSVALKKRHLAVLC